MSGDTTVIEKKKIKLKLDEIVLPEISKEKFVIKAADLYRSASIRQALDFAEASYGLEFCEKHVFPVVDLIREHFKSKDMTFKKYDTTVFKMHFSDVFITAALHDVRETGKLTEDFVNYYSGKDDKDFLRYYLLPAMRCPAKIFKKPIEQTLEQIKRLKVNDEASYESKMIAIANKICELPYLLKGNQEKIEANLEASIPYLMLAEDLQLTEFYEKLKKVMIQGFKLLE